MATIELSNLVYERNRPQIGTDRIACIYDSSQAGELELCEAYFDAYGLSKDYFYPVDFSDNANVATTTILNSWLRTFFDWVDTNDIQQVCVSPNAPQTTYDEPVSINATILTLAQAAKHWKAWFDSITPASSPLQLNDTNLSSDKDMAGLFSSDTAVPNGGTAENKPFARHFLEGVTGYDNISGVSNTLTIGGIDVADFNGNQTGNGEVDECLVLFDFINNSSGTDGDIDRLPGWRIGWPGCTTTQIATMVANSRSVAGQDFSYHQSNSPISLITNERATLISSAQAIALMATLDEIGYGYNFTYNEDQTKHENHRNIAGRTVGDTGLTKFAVNASDLDENTEAVATWREVASGGTNTGSIRYVPDSETSPNLYRFTARNGNTFPISSFLIYSQVGNFQASNQGAPYKDGTDFQVFNIQAGGGVIEHTSFGMRIGADALEAGASFVIGGVDEPGVEPVQRSTAFILSLLQGNTVANAWRLTTECNVSAIEIWGDGLAQPFQSQSTYTTVDTPMKLYTNGRPVVNADDSNNSDALGVFYSNLDPGNDISDEAGLGMPILAATYAGDNTGGYHLLGATQWILDDDYQIDFTQTPMLYMNAKTGSAYAGGGTYPAFSTSGDTGFFVVLAGNLSGQAWPFGDVEVWEGINYSSRNTIAAEDFETGKFHTIGGIPVTFFGVPDAVQGTNDVNRFSTTATASSLVHIVINDFSLTTGGSVRTEYTATTTDSIMGAEFTLAAGETRRFYANPGLAPGEMVRAHIKVGASFQPLRTLLVDTDEGVNLTNDTGQSQTYKVWKSITGKTTVVEYE